MPNEMKSIFEIKLKDAIKSEKDSETKASINNALKAIGC
jgi:hypothetical protein